MLRRTTLAHARDRTLTINILRSTPLTHIAPYRLLRRVLLRLMLRVLLLLLPLSLPLSCKNEAAEVKIGTDDDARAAEQMEVQMSLQPLTAAEA